MHDRAVFRIACLFLFGALLAALAGCQRQAPAAAASTATPSGVPAAFAWPASLKPFGEGYPRAGDPCQRLGESPSVAAYLDHTSVLVGCPGPADATPAATLLSDGQGKAVANIDGVTVIVLPPNAAL